jgi:hypothetical protein
MERLDAHCHVGADHADSRALLDSLGLRILDIALGTDPLGKWRDDACNGSEALARMVRASPGHCGWVTAFDEPRFSDPGWADSVIAGLKRDFARGAVGVKVWKNIGLKVRRPGVGNVLPDDPVFEPVYSWLEETGKTLAIHVGEALAAWEPTDPRNPHEQRYRRSPGGRPMARPGIPSHGELIRARDNIMERHPRLRVVGCHLGSLEHDVREVAARLDRYPNFAVDTAARVLDLSAQDVGLVRDFFAKYHDRILWGVDLFTWVTDDYVVKAHSVMTDEERRWSVEDLTRRWSEEYEFYESAGELEFRGWEDKPWRVRGLGLSGGILNDFHLNNALRWYPGLFGKEKETGR